MEPWSSASLFSKSLLFCVFVLSFSSSLHPLVLSFFFFFSLTCIGLSTWEKSVAFLSIRNPKKLHINSGSFHILEKYCDFNESSALHFSSTIFCLSSKHKCLTEATLELSIKGLLKEGREFCTVGPNSLYWNCKHWCEPLEFSFLHYSCYCYCHCW